MKRRFRLTSSTDFKRVRRLGKSFAHPLVVLMIYPNEIDRTRFGVAASRALGSAVARNRARRRLRAGLSPHLSQVAPGWDVVLIARKALGTATFTEIQGALFSLLQQASLIQLNHERS